MRKIFVVAIVFWFFTGIAQASSLYVGGNYSHINSVVNGHLQQEGGGSIDISKLDNKTLPWLYCVDLFTNVYINQSYANTSYNINGIIHNNVLKNVGEVAWLLDHYGTGGQGEQAKALQAAIWTVINGWDTYHLDIDPTHNTTSLIALYNTMLNESKNQIGNISSYLWINPGKSDSDSRYQGLVAPAPTPEPATMLLFGAGIAGIAGLRFRKKK